MSRDHFRDGMRTVLVRACLGLCGALLLQIPVVDAAAQSQSKMMKIEERRLVRTVHFKFTILQAGNPAGWEDVTRNDYSDNSVQFKSEVLLEFQQGAKTDIRTDLLLEEETFFPLKFEIDRNTKQGDVEFDIGSSIEWFSNVATVCKTSRGAKDTLNVVLPAGAAVVDMNVAHHLYVPLYWYDAASGGVQSFNVVDPISAKSFPATLRLQVSEKTSVNGEEIDTERYEFTRDKLTYKIYVDADGRIVKVDQGFLVYELSEWSENNAGGE